MADPRPFLKNVGGKTALLPELMKCVPSTYGTYYEPFIGGGALFFALKPARAVIADADSRLIKTYQAVRDSVDGLVTNLTDYYTPLFRAHGEKFYYHVRDQDPDKLSPLGVAGWQIFLNKTCYCGMRRVNKAGKFNVPIGKFKTPPTICDEENLRACSVVLRDVAIRQQDFRAVEQQAQPGDFVYFDPPYVPLSKSSNFTSYTGDFGAADQTALRDMARRMKDRGVHVLLSNSSAAAVSNLYDTGFEIAEVEMRRSINSKTDARGVVKEFLIR